MPTLIADYDIPGVVLHVKLVQRQWLPLGKCPINIDCVVYARPSLIYVDRIRFIAARVPMPPFYARGPDARQSL